MVNPIVGNILLIALLILVGGIFAAAEIALVSLRDSQVTQLSVRGKRGQTVAHLASNPNLFLSAVQIGITLSGFLSAAFGGATLADELAPVLVGWGLMPTVANTVALVLITVVISYFSILFGELTAKRLAMQNAEAFAMTLAPLLNVIAIVTRPVIWFLGVSTNVAVRLFGGDPGASREEVTQEELRHLVFTSPTLGRSQRRIVDEVFAAGDVSLREAMVPRTEVDFLPGDMPVHKALHLVEELTHSRYPVVGRDVDDVLGFVHLRDLFMLDPGERNTPIRQLVRSIRSYPQTVKILYALSDMRQTNTHLALVSDEYGGTAGIVTIEDIIEELVGDIADEFDPVAAAHAPAGETLTSIDGLTTLEEFAGEYKFVLPEGPYDTVAGYVMAQLGKLPEVGDQVVALLLPNRGPVTSAENFEFTVLELDGRRVASFQIRRLGPLPA